MFPFDIHNIVQQFLYNSREPLIFSSGLFLWLFLAFMWIYLVLVPHLRARLIFVTLFSLYFYYKSSGVFFILLLLATVVDFTLAAWIHKSEIPWKRKLFLILSLAINLGVLGYFKYTNFFLESWAALSGGQFQPMDIFLPVGISFFTFQSLSYTLDVYRGNLKPVDSLLDYAFYLSFFPQLVAGPIVRAADFLPQIRQTPVVTPEMLGRAVFLIGTGLFKKAVISDYISLNFVDRVFADPTLYTGFENLIAIYGYALQIYCDFSGYSDMAIGIALLLGFHFNLNFDSPYQSSSITEFWRRWHISLSSWLKDYLYISLGGNRKGKVRTYINLFLTMLLGGLWHGAAWRFVIWGGLHGVALALHKATLSWYKPGPFWKVAGVLLTFHFVCFCWIFFRAPDMASVVAMLNSMINNFHPEIAGQFLTGYKVVSLLMVTGFILHFTPESWSQWLTRQLTTLPLVGKAAFLVAIIVLVIQTKSSGVQPFIYFQF